MSNMKLRSMRARMTALFALFVALLMLVAGGAVQRHEGERAEKRVDEILTVARELAIAEINRNISEESLLATVRADAGEIAAGGLTLIVAQNDRVLWQSRRRAPDWPNINEDWRARTLAHDGQTLILASDWKPIRDDLAGTARALWILGVLVVCATAVAAWFVVGITLSPLDALGGQARAASTGNGGDKLAVRLSSPSSDAEMTTLTQTLNGLLERLQREARARGRFYAAASHELRTPIQALLGEVEVALTRPRSGPFYRETLGQVHSETKRLKSLVQDLLQLNALEMRQVQAAPSPLDLRESLKSALLQGCEFIGERDLHLEARLEAAEIEAPPAHVEILLRNLLENAIKYATPGSTLKLETGARKGRAHLRVWNACDLPVGSDLSGWFEPFYRPDESRNSQTGGNGLGLSIVATLARANGWQVELKQHESGVEAQVWFPMK